LKGLPEAAADIGALNTKLQHFLDPTTYIDSKLDEIRNSSMPPEKRIAAIAVVEAERAAIPGIVAQLNREIHVLSKKFVPAGRKLISKVLEIVAEMIMTRVESA